MALGRIIISLLANLVLFNVAPVMAHGQHTNSTFSPVTITATVTVTVAAQPTFGPPPGCNLPLGFPLGCWLENGAGRVLPEAWFDDEYNMTMEMCAGLCQNYTLFGVEYGSQCFCANSFHADQGFPVDISQCNMPYVGNSSEMCGGARALLVYQSLPPPPPPPPGLVSNITYSAAGCYAEPPDGSRALDGFVIANANMTSEGCAYVCGLSNHLYYGLEYSDECWCGNNVSPNASIVSSATCNMPCKGNSSETCGGSLLLNLYNGTYHARDLPLPIDRFYNPEPRLLSFIQPVPVPEPFWCGNRSVETISG